MWKRSPLESGSVEAVALCDRVAILDQGRLGAMDTVPELIPAHAGDTAVRLTLDRPTPPTRASVEGTSSVSFGTGMTIVRLCGAIAQTAFAHLSQIWVVVTDMTTSSDWPEALSLSLTGRTKESRGHADVSDNRPQPCPLYTPRAGQILLHSHRRAHARGDPRVDCR